MHRPLSSPILFGRDDLLALGARRAEGARGGRGHLLFLAGEAGIGKTRLLGAIARQAAGDRMRLVRAGAVPSDLEVAGGLLLDLAHDLTTSVEEVYRDAGAALLDRLRADAAPGGDAHRRRRLLVLDMADTIAQLADRHDSVLLALEDLHWADDLTLETLGYLARRLSGIPMLIVATYRSDELYPRVPMREWRARMLVQRQAEEVRLDRLGMEETSAMAGLLLGGTLPAPRHLVDALHARSDGIPLHVEEILGAMRQTGGAGGASLATGLMRVPDTLTDAILTRRGALSRRAAAAADAVAVIDRSFDLDMLSAVLGQPDHIAGAAIDELQARYFVVPAKTSGWFEFRHALIRDALEEATPVARRRTLHKRVCEHAMTRPDIADPAFLSKHYESAGLSAEAYRHALAAAGRAVALSAHREALDLYRRAVRCSPADLPPATRARLIADRAAEEAATDDNEAAAASYSEARRIFLDGGESGAAADLVPAMVAVRHLLGDDLEARVGLLTQGLAEARADRGGRVRVGREARVEAGLAAAYMLDRRLDEAAKHGDRAIGLAGRAGDEVTELNAMTTVGSILVLSGLIDQGWARLEEALSRSRAARLEAEAARAFRMMGSSGSVLVEYERGERALRDGIEYAERTEQWNHRHYMAAHLGHVLWATGAWDEAITIASRILAEGGGGITTRITCLHVLGYVALGRGEWAVVESTLGEARRLGEEMAELQRFSPALWGLAEAARLQGRYAEARDLSEMGYGASAAVRDAVYLFPFLVTGLRARLALDDLIAAERWVDELSTSLRERSIPGTLPAIDHARGLLALANGATGQARVALAAARQGWLERRRAWEGCWATIDLARCSQRANRPAEASSLLAGAVASAESMGASMLVAQAREVEAVLRRRGVTQERWAPLTAREFQVASLIAVGRTNREIGAELGITLKTVAAHVEHILARLGAERRTEIATWVTAVRGRTSAP